MVSPMRKYAASPKRARKYYAPEEPAPLLDQSFDLFDSETTISNWYSVRVPGVLPHKRSFHASAIVKNTLYVIGGIDLMEDILNDVWALDLKNVMSLMNQQKEEGNTYWQLFATTGESPGKISNLRAVSIGDRIYCYGGILSNGASSQNLYILDVNSRNWTKFVPNKTQPLGRDGHSMQVAKDGMIYIFGGYIGGRCCNELWKFDPEEQEWTQLKSSGDFVPAPRANHGAALWEGESGPILIISGGIKEDSERLSDVWFYDIITQTWKEHSAMSGELFIGPSCRSEHSMVIYNNSAVLFGGRSNAMKELNDVMILDLYRMQWDIGSELCLKPSPDKSFVIGVSPSPGKFSIQAESTFSCAANQIKPSSSGMRKSAHQPESPGWSPVRRKKKVNKKLNATEIESELQELKILTPTTSAMLNSVVMRCGEKVIENSDHSPTRRKTRISTLHGLMRKPEQPDDTCVRGRIPCARSGHTSEIFEKYLVIFGGDRAQMAMNDIYLFDLSRATL